MPQLETHTTSESMHQLFHIFYNFYLHLQIAVSVLFVMLVGALFGLSVDIIIARQSCAKNYKTWATFITRKK